MSASRAWSGRIAGPVSPSLAPASLLLLWRSESDAVAPGFVKKEDSEPARLPVIVRERSGAGASVVAPSAPEGAAGRPAKRLP
jgi:hypothetical protein